MTSLFHFSGPKRLGLWTSFSRHNFKRRISILKKTSVLECHLLYGSLLISRMFFSYWTQKPRNFDIFHYLKLIENQLCFSQFLDSRKILPMGCSFLKTLPPLHPLVAPPFSETHCTLSQGIMHIIQEELRETWWLICNDLRHLEYFIHFIFIFFKINTLTILGGTLILKRSHIYYIYTRSLSSCLLSPYPQVELFMRNLNANKDTKPWGPLALLYLTSPLFKYSCRIALSRNFKMCYDKTFSWTTLLLMSCFLSLDPQSLSFP